MNGLSIYHLGTNCGISDALCWYYSGISDVILSPFHAVAKSQPQIMFGCQIDYTDKIVIF